MTIVADYSAPHGTATTNVTIYTIFQWLDSEFQRTNKMAAGYSLSAARQASAAQSRSFLSCAASRFTVGRSRAAMFFI